MAAVAAVSFCMTSFCVLPVMERRRCFDVPPEPAGHRHVTSACGVCGTASIDDVRKHGTDLSGDATTVSPAVLAGLPDAMRARQRTFDRTGGLHATVVRDDERDATVVVGTAPAGRVSESSPSAVTHAVTVRGGSVTP